MRLRQGELSGVEAFGRRLLEVRGNLDYAVGFEGMFRLPNGRPPLLQIHDIPVGRHRISTMTMGRGPDVLLLHGLGGTRASLFETAATLSRRYRVHAPDLPGFGSSSKPPLGAYNARWFADIMLGLMDQLDITWAHIVGNSLGGRIAIEIGLNAPERTGALGLLCPAVAWVRRSLHPLVRMLRPELGMLPHAIRRSLISMQFWSMFHDRDAIDPAVDYSGEPTTLVEFRLEEVAGGTELTVSESGFDQIPAARRAEAFRMNERGWATQLKNIERHVSA